MTSGPPLKDHTVSFSLPTHANGILPDRMIAAMADDGLILPAYPFVESQIQPASLVLEQLNARSSELNDVEIEYRQEVGPPRVLLLNARRLRAPGERQPVRAALWG